MGKQTGCGVTCGHVCGSSKKKALRWDVCQHESLRFIEDAGLLKGVLGFGHIPHSDCSIISTCGQQAFFTAPTARDNLIWKNKSQKHILIKHRC